MALSSIFAPTLTESGTGLMFKKLRDQAHDVVLANWHLGFTAFGGPPVHFQIVCDYVDSYLAYVMKEQHSDEQKVTEKIR